MRGTLFIADLHLDTKRPRITKLFIEFLKTQAHTAEALFILGDLFEYWIGDDDPATGIECVISALRELADSGTQVYFQHGNRDFLVGKRFTKRTGCALLDESTVIDLYGQPTLLMHGDLLCTDDIAYQAYRAKVQNRLVQKLLLSLSIKTRLKIAANLRKKSRDATGSKTAIIMDVNQQAVEQAMRKHKVRHLIHGHTHKPAIHEFTLDRRPATRTVLGDWYTQGSVFRCKPSGCQLITLPLQHLQSPA